MPFPPRLEARIQFVDEDAFLVHVWRLDQASGERHLLVNGKHAGSRKHAYAIIRECAEHEGLPLPGPEDIDVG